MRSAEPYASPQRVFWGVDNATIHRGEQAATRLRTWPNLVLVYLPRHASWPNQIEIYFSILARKALTPAHFDDVDELAARARLPTRVRQQRAALPLDLHPPTPPRAPGPPRSAPPTRAGPVNELA